MRILLVEDDEILGDILTQALSEHRYLVEVAEDGQLGWQYAQNSVYDLLIIDVGLPRLDGITLCQRLRGEACSTPILLMTAKDAPEERIRGLDAGADDYLTKPLDMGELQARVRALLRRGDVSPTSVLTVGSLQLDPVSCEVTHDGRPLKLTPKEYSLLELFLRNPSRVFSRGQIVEHLWSFDDPPLEESVKAHVKGLRRKLKEVGAADWVENVYGLGYRLIPKAPPMTVANVPVPTDTPTKPIVETPIALDSQSQSTEAAFNQAMAQLWQQYQGLMMERLQVLQTAARAMSMGMLTAETRQAASKAAHKLAGVLGMFGQDQGTQLARELETQLESANVEPSTNVPALVEQLAALLQIGVLSSHLDKASAPSDLPPRLLWVGSNRQLGLELQSLTQSAGLGWHIVETIAAGADWLTAHTPDLVVLQVDEFNLLADSLPLLNQLSARTPAIPSLVITDSDELSDRIQMAAAGIAGILTAPVTATHVWDMASQMLQQHHTHTVNLLAVDDDPLLLEALRAIVEPWGMRLFTLTDPTQFWNVLHATKPDLLILDVEMPEFNGIELCQAVRTDPQWQDLPIVFLTAHREPETVRQVFMAGADDYVTKPILGAELLTRLTNRLERNQLLQRLSRRDSKTGLANQPHSQQQLEQLLCNADRTPVCLVVLTLTDLPQINHRYGHWMGHQILKRWGEVLRASLYSGEVSGYWDYGQFVIGLPRLNQTEAIDRLSPVFTLLRRQIFTAQGDRFQVNYTIGLAEFPADGVSVQTLYQIACQPNA
ncbi:response regulator [Thermocoleostomius sinensis]|uniref:Response regulator n=1 Tax=Thermocoleostomius sinensis A174 TaxID=2016057 RepID=A0A9E8ZE18_9CYAN|nr:response regulator [Thermocoleostomius sinensis]WAL59505.1 response regulator [Thermocoleostomius sinensis A174]